MDMPRALTPEEITEERQRMAQRAAEIAIERELQPTEREFWVDIILNVNGHEIRAASTPGVVAKIMALLVGMP